MTQVADSLRIVFAQLDPILGDIAGNAAEARRAVREAESAGADLVAFPEMFISGYQTQDLVQRPAFVADCEAAIAALAEAVADGPAVIMGGPALEDGALYNAAWLLDGGKVRGRVFKHELPTYGVFDEVRLFAPGAPAGPMAVRGVRIGVAVCEDAWLPDVSETLAESGAEILVVINGSPYERGKADGPRLQNMIARVVETGLPLFYGNMVGGQDDQVFDGGSFGLNPGGALAFMAPFFDETLVAADAERGADGAWRFLEGVKAAPLAEIEIEYRAMVEGVRGYFAKTGFTNALLGLSGGVDSALVAAIAADALGPEQVRCVMLPSQFTSSESLEDAAAVAAALGCPLDTAPIESGVAAVEAALAPLFAGAPRDLTEENIQSRLRGLYLMALSNKTGALLLTTGNKSEVAVGYATLYGDMCGAFNPIKDLYKMRVFETCRWRSEAHRPWMKGPAGAVIPPRVIEKPPSAELREDQKDSDSLPPYPVLDAILEMMVDADASVAEIVAAGHEREDVLKVAQLVRVSEYKRRQAAPGVKLSRRAFWLDRRYPLANRWRDETR